MTDKRILEDLLTLAGDAFAHLADARHDIKAHLRGPMESVARDLNLVTRNEFEAAFAMLKKARNAQEDLAARLEKIESFLNLSSAKKTVNRGKRNLPSVKRKTKRRAKK